LERAQVDEIVVDDEQAPAPDRGQLARNGHVVAVEELDEIGDANAPMTARGAKGCDPALVHPVLPRAGVHPKELADLVRGKKPVGVDFLLVHDFHLLATFPKSVNATKLSRATRNGFWRRHEFDAASSPKRAR